MKEGDSDDEDEEGGGDGGQEYDDDPIATIRKLYIIFLNSQKSCDKNPHKVESGKDRLPLFHPIKK